MIFVSLGCLSSTTEHVGSISTSNITICSGRSNKLVGSIFNIGAIRDDNAIGI